MVFAGATFLIGWRAKRAVDEVEGPAPPEWSEERLAAIKRVTVFVKLEGKIRGNGGDIRQLVPNRQGRKFLVATSNNSFTSNYRRRFLSS